MKKRYTQDQFIEKARQQHGNKYNYDKVVYTFNKTKVIITCPVHGDFEQRPVQHVFGCGCPGCKAALIGDRFRLTLDDFLRKAKEVHGDKYDYSNVVYLNNSNKVLIKCKLHGEFYQSPTSHIHQRQGCPTCGGTGKLTTERFIKEAKLIHGDRYDYSKVLYKNKKSKVTITCHKHGDFEQAPSNHTGRKAGCPKCKGEFLSTLLMSNVDEFISKAKTLHNGIYDYSKVKYSGNKKKVTITCRKHGDWEQSPNDHLAGYGCPVCSASKGELLIKAILDKHHIRHQQEYRIPEVCARLHYDFYLPDYNVLIEFHGRQHYEYIPFFHRNEEDNFLAQKIRDDIARDNARSFKYGYLEFNYQQLKQLSVEEFENKLLEKLSGQRNKGVHHAIH